MKRTSPTVRRRQLARELKQLRRESGKSRDEVAQYADVAPSTITKIENASAAARVTLVSTLCQLYGVSDEKRDLLTMLAREASQKSWWQAFSGAIPQWFETYVGLEEEASEIRTWHPEMIDGRLQTEGYMRALILAEVEVPADEEIDRRVAVRLKRQEQLTSAEPLQLWSIVGEGALRQMVGGAEVMREQLQNLLEMSRLNNVTLQVLPASVGAHPGMQGGFHFLRFAEDPDVAYIEYRQGSIYLERDEDVSTYARVLDLLVARALGPDQSRDLIRRVLRELSR